MKKTEIAVFGGRCFWCTEAIFKSLKGVEKVTPGYAGGNISNPNYYEVSTGDTGHAEVIKIEYDPAVINYNDLLEIFWHIHNPTSLNRQGNDVGTQYRSIILYANDDQKKLAEQSKSKLQKSEEFENQIVTEIVPLKEFFEAEDYHKDYFANHKDEPYCQLVISPKLQKLKEKYWQKIR